MQGVLSVDCFIPAENCIVEVHGPYHYTAEGKLTVKSEQHKRLLKKMGYEYIIVKYDDWYKLSGLD